MCVISCTETRDGAKYPEVRRIAPTTKNDLTSNVNSAEVESSRLRPSYGLIFTTDVKLEEGS